MSRNAEEPFCLFICSIHAHAPWDAGDSSRWELDELKLPPHFVDTEVTRHHFRELLAEIRLFDDQVGRAEELLKNSGWMKTPSSSCWMKTVPGCPAANGRPSTGASVRAA
jgi:uncharacterized sulfatase